MRMGISLTIYIVDVFDGEYGVRYHLASQCVGCEMTPITRSIY
jgi:hypothetical protein